MTDEGYPDVRVAAPGDEGQIMDLVRLWHSEIGLFNLAEVRVEEAIHNAVHKKAPGVVGVIEQDGRLVASTGLGPGRAVWFSIDMALHERWSFVHPDHRKSNYARQLLKFGKAAQQAFEADGDTMPLVATVTCRSGSEGKVNLYNRYMSLCGATFYYGRPLGNTPPPKPLKELDASGVRLATPEDEDAIFDLGTTMHEEIGLQTQEGDYVRQALRLAASLKPHPETGQIGVVGVIDGEDGKPAASIGLFTNAGAWWTDDLALHESWIFVHPDHRKSKHVERLLDFAALTQRQLEGGTYLPLLIGVYAKHRIETKIRLMKRFYPLVAMHYIYGRSATEAAATVAPETAPTTPDAPHQRSPAELAVS